MHWSYQRNDDQHNRTPMTVNVAVLTDLVSDDPVATARLAVLVSENRCRGQTAAQPDLVNSMSDNAAMNRDSVPAAAPSAPPPASVPDAALLAQPHTQPSSPPSAPSPVGAPDIVRHSNAFRTQVQHMFHIRQTAQSSFQHYANSQLVTVDERMPCNRCTATRAAHGCNDSRCACLFSPPWRYVASDLLDIMRLLSSMSTMTTVNFVRGIGTMALSPAP